MILQNNTLMHKNVLITGASGGLGGTIAAEYAKRGCNLFLTGRDQEKLLSLKQQIYNFMNEKVKINIETCDLEEEVQIYALVERVKSIYDRIDILVNCAGVFPVKSLSDINLKEYKRCININLTAPFILIKEFSKEMVESGWGQIINVASSSAYAGGANTSVYCASKHGLLGLSRSLHKELNKHNIRVICVSPGSIKTEMGREVEKLGQDFDTFIDPQELAEYIMFNSLLSDNLISEEIRLNRRFIQ